MTAPRPLPAATASSPIRRTRPPSPAERNRPASPFAALLVDVRATGLLEKRPGYYAVVAGINGAVGIGALTVLVAAGPGVWQLATAVVLGLVLAQFGFLAHEAAHRQVFEHGPTNDLAARIIGPAIVGLSYTWWQDGHNRHHAHPNVAGRDPSVDPSVFVFRRDDVAGRSALQRRVLPAQGYLMPPALLFEGLALRLTSLSALVRRRPDREHGFDLLLLLLRLIALPVLVLTVLPLELALAFLAVQSAVFGLYLGGAFIPNHIGMPVLGDRHGLDHLHKQVLTSRNLRGGAVMNVLTGGLSLQIEHHLFPGMPRPNLLKVRPLVVEHCRLNGIPYVEVSTRAAWLHVVRHLNGVGGRMRGAFRCPVAEQCGRS